MPEWQWNPYKGIDPQLLMAQVNRPSASAAGLNAFSQGLFGDSNQHGALGSIEQMIKQQKQKQLVQQLVSAMGQQGAPQQGPQLPGAGMTSGQPAPASGMGAAPQDNSAQIMALMTQINPEEAIKAKFKSMGDQSGMSPAFTGPQGQFSPTMQPGFKPFGSVDRGDLMKTMVGQQEKGASLEEKAKEAESSRQLRETQQQIALMMAQGRHDEALARIDELKNAVEQRKQSALMQAQLKAQIANAQHPIRNAWRSLRGKPPVVPIPGEDDTGSGWTDADEKRLKELEAQAK
jgi:hypothetical protein